MFSLDDQFLKYPVQYVDHKVILHNLYKCSFLQQPILRKKHRKCSVLFQFLCFSKNFYYIHESMSCRMSFTVLFCSDLLYTSQILFQKMQRQI